jgi:hypothetical protein
MHLWIPPGADVGESAPPAPDPMMVKFIGGFDGQGRARPMTFRRLKEVADSLVITSTTPEGPATLLATGRDMFALAFYQYKLLFASASFSIFAVEAALKLRLGLRANFHSLVRKATEDGLITAEVADVVEAGRRIRNNFVHEGKLTQWTFGMAFNGVGASYRLVGELYPEDTDLSCCLICLPSRSAADGGIIRSPAGYLGAAAWWRPGVLRSRSYAARSGRTLWLLTLGGRLWV